MSPSRTASGSSVTDMEKSMRPVPKIPTTAGPFAPELCIDTMPPLHTLTVSEHQITADAYFEIVRELREFLPGPDHNDPDGETRRDNAAIAECAALCPCTEARLAARDGICNERALKELRRWKYPSLPDKDRTRPSPGASPILALDEAQSLFKTQSQQRPRGAQRIPEMRAQRAPESFSAKRCVHSALSVSP